MSRPSARFPHRRRLRWLLALCAVLLLVAGCDGVPDSGDPQVVRQVPAGSFDDEPGVRAQPRAPNQGDTPEEIVRGFLAAGKGPADQHAIAREYLTPAASASWKDSSGVQVIDVDQVTPDQTARQVVVTGHYLGRIDNRDQSYVAEGKPLHLVFTLKQVDGEWRIDNPPSGLLLPQSDFAQVYRAVDLYFLAPSGGTVVPDRRYLDVRQAALPTAMITLLLDGPSAWLAPGVRSAFPEGTQLRSNVVSDGDVLVVDLTQQAESASPADRARMAAQLSWTLRGFGVKGVRFLVEGRPFAVQQNGTLIGRNKYASYDPDHVSDETTGFYLAGGQVETTGEAAAGTGGGPTIQSPTGLQSAAVSADLSQLAGVRAAGARQQLLLGPVQGPQPVRYTAGSLTAPSFGGSADGVYVVADGDRLLRVSTTGAVSAISVPGLATYGPVQVLRVARDGVRVALVAGTGRQRTLLVGVLHQAGSTWTLTGLRALATDLANIADVSWLDATSLVVLGQQPRGGLMPWEVDVDGATESPGTVTGLPQPPVRIATAPGQPDLAESGGRIWRRAGSSWASPGVTTAPRGGHPFYPG